MSVFYFAYGSNLDIERLEKGVGKVVNKNGIFYLNDYNLSFDKISKDGTAKANVLEHRNKRVLGVVYELTENQFETLKKYEKGYDIREVFVYREIENRK